MTPDKEQVVEPLTTEEIEDIRVRGTNLALVDPRFYSLWGVINRLLATLDAERAAQGGLREADIQAIAIAIERHTWNYGNRDAVAATIRAALAAQPTPTLDAAGAALIAAERRRQIEVERYDAAHDSGHADELALAGAVYATPARKRRVADRMASDISERASIYRVPEEWPWHPGYYKPVPGDRIRELVKAGALIAAAIDALAARLNDTASEPDR